MSITSFSSPSSLHTSPYFGGKSKEQKVKKYFDSTTLTEIGIPHTTVDSKLISLPITTTKSISELFNSSSSSMPAIGGAGAFGGIPTGSIVNAQQYTSQTDTAKQKRTREIGTIKEEVPKKPISDEPDAKNIFGVIVSKIFSPSKADTQIANVNAETQERTKRLREAYAEGQKKIEEIQKGTASESEKEAQIAEMKADLPARESGQYFSVALRIPTKSGKQSKMMQVLTNDWKRVGDLLKAVEQQERKQAMNKLSFNIVKHSSPFSLDFIKKLKKEDKEYLTNQLNDETDSTTSSQSSHASNVYSL
jgi:hypothetical protein